MVCVPVTDVADHSPGLLKDTHVTVGSYPSSIPVRFFVLLSSLVNFHIASPLDKAAPDIPPAGNSVHPFPVAHCAGIWRHLDQELAQAQQTTHYSPTVTSVVSRRRAENLFMGLLVFVLQIFSKHDMGESVASDICCYPHVKDAKTTQTRPSLPDTNMPSRAEITINMQDRTHHRPHPACLPQPGVTSGCRSLTLRHEVMLEHVYRLQGSPLNNTVYLSIYHAGTVYHVSQPPSFPGDSC